MYFRLLFLGMFSATAFSYADSVADLDKLLLNRDVPQAQKEVYIDRILPLVQNIKSVCRTSFELTKCLISINFTLPRLKDDILYNAFNPSIVRTTEGYDVMCRISNWTLPDYRPIIPGDGIRNKIFFLRYDQEFNLLSEQEINIPLHLSKHISLAYQVADCRIFHWNNSCWFLGVAKVSDTPKVALCKFDCFDGITPIVVQSLQLFYGPQPFRWEKNWMPFLDGGKLKFVYSYDPFIVYEPDIEKGTCETVFTYKPTLDFSRFRGSAAPIDFENGYLMMVHERLRRYNYVHRFLYLDKSFHITKITEPFTFTHSGVEFCLSMTIDHSGKNLAIPIGIEDKEAKLLLVDLEYVKELLNDIPV
jgi:hypothetical protein